MGDLQEAIEKYRIKPRLYYFIQNSTRLTLQLSIICIQLLRRNFFLLSFELAPYV